MVNFLPFGDRLILGNPRSPAQILEMSLAVRPIEIYCSVECQRADWKSGLSTTVFFHPGIDFLNKEYELTCGLYI